MKSKVGFTLALVGTVLGFAFSAWEIAGYFIAKTAVKATGDMMGGIVESATQGTEAEGIPGMFLGGTFGIAESALTFMLIFAIIGIIISIISIIFVIKASKEDCTRTPFIVLIVLGALGIFLGLGWIAGGLILAGGIVGVVQAGKPSSSTANLSPAVSE